MMSIRIPTNGTQRTRECQGRAAPKKAGSVYTLIASLMSLLPLTAVQATGYDTLLGHVDGVEADPNGAVVVRGWACWKTWSWTSPQVDIYVGGEYNKGGIKLGTYQSNQPNEPAVDQVCETNNTPHRFAITLNISMRQQYAGKAIYIYGVPAPTYNNYTLLGGSGQFTVPAAPVVADSVYYIHTDRLGSNVIMTDANANIVAKTDYTAYGTAALDSSKSEAPGYTGHYEDPLTGLTYMQARYYDSDLGRFISNDPVAASPGDVFNFNRYAYARNNPLVFVDADGREAEKLEGATVQGWVQHKRYYFDGMGGGGVYVSRAGVNANGPGEGGGVDQPRKTLEKIEVTANRPPDIDRQVIWGFTAKNQVFARQFDSIYGGWNRFLRLFQKGELNVSVGLGVAGQVMPDYADAEAGFAFDSNKACLYGSSSGGGGLGGIWGAGGVSVGVGTGPLSSGTQTTYGSYWAGGEGFAGEGKIGYTPGGGLAYSRGIFGGSISATGTAFSAGGFVNRTAYWCL